MKIIFEKMNGYKGWDLGKYDLVKTFADIGYYFDKDNNLIFYYYINRYLNRIFNEMLNIEKVIKSSTELKWCLLNYKIKFDYRFSNEVQKMLHLFIEDRIKLGIDNMNFEVVEVNGFEDV